MTKKIAFIFPGQGAQAVGMGKDLFENYDVAKKVFETADKVLGKSVTSMSRRRFKTNSKYSTCNCDNVYCGFRSF